MIRCLSLLVCLAFVFQAAWARAQDAKPTIAAAAVESTGSAEIVRLIVSPSVDEISHKIICGEVSIRVRLGGVAARRKSIENLTVSKESSMELVRIVPRGRVGSVIQLFPRRRALAACSRTTLVVLGGEIVISTALSNSDKSRHGSALVRTESDLVRSESALATKQDDAQSKNAAPAPKKKSTAKKKKESTPLFGKNKSKPSKTADAKKKPVAEGFAIETNAVRLMAAFGIAAIVAGLALYFKKRRRGIPGGGDTIEILSSKRLGGHQQLVLASVQNTKFLLAIGEKSVSTLGIVPDGASSDIPPTNEMATNADSDGSALAEWLGSEAHQPETPDTSVKFQRELKRAVSAAMAVDAVPPPVEDRLSNAAGLIAMARMRAETKRNQKNREVVEA
ncbi:MAG: flagellar biosynthetic protein FliO [Deltaproteobacteria bacterium]|nr:flagellar biosynthetic protein FliO [Deltaproteobacteria bacterium]